MSAAVIYMDLMNAKRLILAVTGASGVLYAARLARAVSRMDGVELHCILSSGALEVMRAEQDCSPEFFAGHAHMMHAEKDIAAPPASGSWQNMGMIVCPCSMASLGAIANGLGNNLIHRAADVTLKERRRLVLVTRETPLNAIHIGNMLSATNAGATIMPASPGFYHRPQSITELADHLAGRVLDQFQLPHALFTPWGEKE